MRDRCVVLGRPCRTDRPGAILARALLLQTGVNGRRVQVQRHCEDAWNTMRDRCVVDRVEPTVRRVLSRASSAGIAREVFFEDVENVEVLRINARLPAEGL